MQTQRGSPWKLFGHVGLRANSSGGPRRGQVISIPKVRKKSAPRLRVPQREEPRPSDTRERVGDP